MAMPPMPPKDMASAQQGPTQPDPDAAAEGEDQSGGDPRQLLIDVHSGLAKVLALVSKAGAPASVVKQLKMSLDSYRSGVEELMSGGGQEQHNVAPSEVGGNPNAVPMG